ncbi:hypothetical protein LY78DRAFT_277209 [Colletotrichum sublineola]|nr:hypothetical protein LY78DRAFT_277209 [Colletotrichum sublineola]
MYKPLYRATTTSKLAQTSISPSSPSRPPPPPPVLTHPAIQKARPRSWSASQCAKDETAATRNYSDRPKKRLQSLPPPPPPLVRNLVYCPGGPGKGSTSSCVSTCRPYGLVNDGIRLDSLGTSLSPPFL